MTLYPPFLFNVVVQALNIMLERARNLGMVKGSYVGTKGAVVPIFNLLMTLSSFVTMTNRRS